MSKPLFPPHIAWPTLIVSLLVASVATGIWTVIQANGFGKAEVIANYHQEALDYDARLAERAASHALGWTSTLSLEEGDVVVVVQDQVGAPIAEATVTVTPARPEAAEAEAALTLRPSADVPGRYAAPIQFSREGRWAFAVRVAQGDDVHLADVRRDVRF